MTQCNFRSLICLLSLVSLFIQGCATTYEGSGPNLKLRGEAARKEIEKYAFVEQGFWTQGYGFEMGPQKTWYTVDSVQPFVDKVSPSANEKIITAKNYRQISLVTMIVSDIILLWAAVTNDNQARQILFPVGLIGLGGSVGLEIKAFSDLSSASQQYNKDLRDKFSPSVALKVGL